MSKIDLKRPIGNIKHDDKRADIPDYAHHEEEYIAISVMHSKKITYKGST